LGSARRGLDGARGLGGGGLGGGGLGGGGLDRLGCPLEGGLVRRDFAIAMLAGG
jgi:hypothetical protein